MSRTKKKTREIRWNNFTNFFAFYIFCFLSVKFLFEWKIFKPKFVIFFLGLFYYLHFDCTIFWLHEFFSSTAPQVQSLKSTAPPPQLIQLRPTGANSGTPGVGQTMQIRPLRAAGGQTGPRPQFFKIVGGKPVQISGANLRQLPASALGK